MKYMHYPALDNLSAALSSSPAPETKVNVRFEVYSVKAIREERKMYKEMEEAYMSGQEEMEEASFSPEMKEAGLSSCFGRLDEKESRKIHFQLVSTLNAAFPDHDFNSLRPDHFTREPDAAAVLGHLSGSLLGQGSASMGPPSSSPLMHSLGSSPSNYPQFPFKAEHTRALQDVIELDSCEVYSWFPSPEYDPHAEVEDGELSEDGFEPEEEVNEEVPDMDIDENETEASWGQAGMDLDVEVEPLQGGGVMETHRRNSKASKQQLGGMGMAMLPPAFPSRSSEEDAINRRAGRLLWSANYFFYSKRQKRILFLTCWCRKRTPFLLSPHPPESELPTPCSSSLSYSSPTHMSTLAHRTRSRVRPKPLGRPAKKQFQPQLTPSRIIRGDSEIDITAMIPIRGMETPKASRMAVSAPAQSGFMSSPSGFGALARMSAGGFKPNRTSAKMMINAARMSEVSPNIAAGPKATSVAKGDTDERTRKQRSESTSSPGANLLQAGMDLAQGAGATKGKRVKV